MRHRHLIALTMATALLSLAGCGLPPEDVAREILPSPTSVQGGPSPLATTGTSGETWEKLFFIKEGMLVSTTRQLTTVPTIDVLTRDLIAGPNYAEQVAGMSSALLGTTVIDNVRTADGHAVVELAAGFEGTGRTDEVLAFAQIVCTLTAQPEITGVSFTHRQQSIGVPRSDGSLSQEPLTAADYADLIADR